MQVLSSYRALFGHLGASARLLHGRPHADLLDPGTPLVAEAAKAICHTSGMDQPQLRRSNKSESAVPEVLPYRVTYLGVCCPLQLGTRQPPVRRGMYTCQPSPACTTASCTCQHHTFTIRFATSILPAAVQHASCSAVPGTCSCTPSSSSLCNRSPCALAAKCHS